MGLNFIETDLKNLLPFKQLDVVLEYIIEAEQPPFRTFSQLQKEVDFEVSTKTLVEILTKLEKDGFVEVNEVANLARYWSTFEGRFFFSESKGYMQRLQNDYIKRKAEKEREILIKKQIESSIITNDSVKSTNRFIKVTSIITVIIVAGTLCISYFQFKSGYEYHENIESMKKNIQQLQHPIQLAKSDTSIRHTKLSLTK